MSKNGLAKSRWVAICIAALLAMWIAVAYILWNRRPSELDGPFFFILVLYLWTSIRFQEQEERLKEMETRIEELEDEAED